ALSLAVSGWAQESGMQLSTNPFLRPVLSPGAPEPTDASGPVRSTAPPSNLRFTLAAGPDSLVNVDGRTLRIGEEINGYRLEAVRADSAVFRNGDELIELEIKPSEIGKRK
ncbi:MAG TPA: hypothetical protein VLS27_20260, partial [Gammaproteobacteria bacterium]|nr:hypothetical protein [Gammaproteobacteria bacterium]